MLIEYRQLYTSKHPPRTEPPPFPTCGHDIIYGAIDFGISTCKSVIVLSENHQLQNAATVVRPFLELSLRLVWCRQVDNGWQRLLANYAKETLDAAEAEKSVDGVNPISIKAICTLTHLSGNAETKLPNLWKMLDFISKKQKSRNAVENIKQTYAIFFKGSLHQLAHANLCYMAFEQNASDPYRLERAIKRSSLWTINSSHDYIDMTAEDAKSFVSKYVDGFLLE